MTAFWPQGRPLIVGARGSALAQRQTALVIEALRARAPDLEMRVEVIRNQGDEDQEPGERPSPLTSPPTVGGGVGVAANQATPMSEEGPKLGQGLFVRALETALVEARIDLAVHSFKDMPSESEAGLTVAAFPAREDPRDVLVADRGRLLNDLPVGTVIGTGSPRRAALLQCLRPDLRVEPIRGNVDTRLRKVREGEYEAIIVAAAGLRRLGLQDVVSEWFDSDIFVPAIGQGILAVQARSDDQPTCILARSIDDEATRCCALAERAVARRVAAGCQTALAAHAKLTGDRIGVFGFTLAGHYPIRAQAGGYPERAEEFGEMVGASLNAQAAAAPSTRV